MNIFVGNLPFDATERDVCKVFERFGGIASCVIVMDKKGKESRGFGFVEMPDERGAYAAIAALDGKEFMGRPLNVSEARPKPESGRDSRTREKKVPRLNAYKQGRRSRSFMAKRAEAGIEGPMPKRKKNQVNPMRWRKKKPWHKAEGEARPWKKTEGEARPWKKAEGEARPWKKAEGEARPWKKAEGEARPWKKADSPSVASEKTEGKSEPWWDKRRKPPQPSHKSKGKRGARRGYKK